MLKPTMPNNKNRAEDARQRILMDMARIQALRELALLTEARVGLYDRLTQMASEVIGAPVSLVSMVTAKHQFFKSLVGLPEPWASERQTPLSHSFCQHVVTSNEPLIIEDARQHPLVKDNLAIPDLNVIGYLGMPITLSDGKSLGSFCVIDSETRTWTATEIEIMREFAAIITAEIDRRAEAVAKNADDEHVQSMHQQLNAMLDTLRLDQAQAGFLADLRAARAQFGW